MKVSVWFNLTRKAYEATNVVRGRPIRQDASAAERLASKRVISTGKTKDEAVKNLAKALDVKVSDLTVVKSKTTYKGKRVHTYNRVAVAA